MHSLRNPRLVDSSPPSLSRFRNLNQSTFPVTIRWWGSSSPAHPPRQPHAAAPVFCDTKGGWLRKSNFQRSSFRPIIARANKKAAEEALKGGGHPNLLPMIRFHDLRHTCATLLLLADVNLKGVSERLGHASIQMTLDTYSHILPTMQKRAVERMDRLFGRMKPRAAGG